MKQVTSFCKKKPLMIHVNFFTNVKIYQYIEGIILARNILYGW